ncbi:phage tail protein, partial [Gilliamella sp. Pra-s52]|uniref:phage tail protein n=1 Tax=Gilliamella sp. Pra-s52 TaxID=2687313 RepID=UPI001434629A
SSTNSTSETEAATSLAVKYAYDLAGQAKWDANIDATTSKKGRVKLSSSTNSTSETEAATSLAVKYAYDLAGQAKWHATNNAAQKTQKINGKQLHGDISLSAADVGALSKSDFNTRIGNPGFEIMPSGLIRQWGTVQLPPVGDYNAVIINGTKYYTNYHQILLPIAFPHNSDSVNVTMACGTMDLQSVMFGTFATANLNGSPSRFTVAITTPVLGASLTVHYEIIGH